MSVNVTFRCDNGHEQEIKYHNIPLEQVKLFVGILDGTSPAYLFPPGNESSIGKCSICGVKFTATKIIRCMDEEEARMIAAQVYCQPLTSHKILDIQLLNVFAEILMREVNYGCDT